LNPVEVPKEWQVDAALPSPLHKQLAMNVRWSISTGAVSRGQILPPVRELAKRMGLSVNTVRLAYKILTEERLVVTRPRRGTEVIGVPEMQPKHLSSESAAEEMMTAAIDRALSAGVSEREVLDKFLALLAQAVEKRSSPKVVFVECTEYDVTMLGQQLSHVLSVAVKPVVLDSLEDWVTREQDHLSEYQAVVTTFFHYADVMEVMKGRGPQVFGVVVENGQETRGQMAQLLPGARIGVVCRAQDSTQYFLNALNTMTGGSAIVRRAFLHQTDAVGSLLEWAQVVFITQPCKVIVEELAPGKPVFFFYDSINEQSLAMLREYLVRAPAATQ
jgi:DNA-binding transcriptional regulator YhcF (GntR family)